MPDGSGYSTREHVPLNDTFGTLKREKTFKRPAIDGSTVPILQEFVAPAIESFNALFDDSGLPNGDGDGRGLLSLAIKDIGEKVVFDGKQSVNAGWGNRMRCKYTFYCCCVPRS